MKENNFSKEAHDAVSKFKSAIAELEAILDDLVAEEKFFQEKIAANKESQQEIKDALGLIGAGTSSEGQKPASDAIVEDSGTPIAEDDSKPAEADIESADATEAKPVKRATRKTKAKTPVAEEKEVENSENIPEASTTGDVDDVDFNLFGDLDDEELDSDEPPFDSIAPESGDVDEIQF